MIKKIGAELRAIRKSKKISVIKLADTAELSTSTIYKLETGSRRVGLVSIARVCDALEINFLHFVAGWSVKNGR